MCEMALAVMPLIGAGLLMRSYYRLSGVDPGFLRRSRPDVPPLAAGAEVLDHRISAGIHPVTFTSVAGTFVLVALLASYIPARRAARVDPMTALRTDYG